MIDKETEEFLLEIQDEVLCLLSVCYAINAQTPALCQVYNFKSNLSIDFYLDEKTYASNDGDNADWHWYLFLGNDFGDAKEKLKDASDKLRAYLYAALEDKKGVEECYTNSSTN